VTCDNHQQLRQYVVRDPEEARWHDSDGDSTTSSQSLEQIFEEQRSAQKPGVIRQQDQRQVPTMQVTS
jgi:hypothetical protein